MAGLPDEHWSSPSVLPEWTVADLVAHLTTVANSAAALEPATGVAVPLSPLEYVGGYAAAADEISATARDVTGRAVSTPGTLRDLLADSFGAACAVLDGLGPANPVVAAPRGPIRLGDYLATRVIEIAVHADDLARSVPDRGPPALPRNTVGLAVRTLLDALAERAPGRAVEVRVPPLGAVQCVEGPRHTRGTPPNVIEMVPATWLRLAAGRMTWADALGAADVSASGDRADLSAYLPLL